MSQEFLNFAGENNWPSANDREIKTLLGCLKKELTEVEQFKEDLDDF